MVSVSSASLCTALDIAGNTLCKHLKKFVINLKFSSKLIASVFNNETVAQFTQEIVHVNFFLSTPLYTCIIRVAGFGLRAEFHVFLSENRSDTKLLRVHLFSIFTIKRPLALAALLIMKTLTNMTYKQRNSVNIFYLSCFIKTNTLLQ